MKIILLKDFLPKIAYNPIKYENSIMLEIDLSEAEIHFSQKENIVQLENFSDLVKKATKIDLKSSMDEALLAANAVDLNIKLIKWRLMPKLEYEKIK